MRRRTARAIAKARKCNLGGSVGPVPKSEKITGEFRNPAERAHGQPWLRPWYMSPRKTEEAAGTRREDTRPPIVPRVHSIARRADGGPVDEFSGLDPIALEAIRVENRGTREPAQMARNAQINQDFLLDSTPVVGNIRSARRALGSGERALTAKHYGHTGKFRRAAAEFALDAVGALAPRPWGRRAGEVAEAGRDTANVLVPAQPSKTADLAREMRINEVPNRTIHKETGRFFGPDGRLRAEVPDRPMVIKRPNMAEGDVAPMGEIIDHPSLFGVHPEMRDIPVNFSRYSDTRGHPIARTSRLGGYEVSSGRDEPFYREQFAKLLNYDAAGKGGFGGAVQHDIHDQFKAYDDALRMAEDIVTNPKPGDDVAAALAYIDRLRPMHQQLAEGIDAQGAIRNTARRGGPSGIDDAMELSRLRGIVEDATRSGNRSTTGNVESRLVRMRSQHDVGGPRSLDRYPYQQGVKIGDVGPNWSKAQVIPFRDMDRDATARLIEDWHKYGIGRPQFKCGGRVARAVARGKSVTGGIRGKTGGREDALPIDVPAGAYVIPADVVAALGGGNTEAGMHALDKKFGRRQRRAAGGRVPILISDGEYVLSPAAVEAAGGNDRLDELVVNTRKAYARHLAELPEPNQ